MTPRPPNPRLATFVGGSDGPWRTVEVRAVTGLALPFAERVAILPGDADNVPGATWTLRGATSNERYSTTAEKAQIAAIQPALGRPEADRAALIPIRKREEWWALSPEERRRIFGERSNHFRIGLASLPAVARRLYHCRDLAEQEPFDFLTWFEFAESDTPAFDHMLELLRATEEWTYVDREVEVRLRREPGADGGSVG